MNLFLRDKAGSPVGPLSPRAIEALAASRVIDDSTPVSLDGAQFAPLGQHADVMRRIHLVMKALMDGDDPWAENQTPGVPPRSAPPRSHTPVPIAGMGAPKPAAAPTPAAPAAPAPATVQAPGADAVEGESILKVLFSKAAARAKGRLLVAGAEGRLDLRYIDGKIVAFDTDAPNLALQSYVLQAKLVDANALTRARQQAASMGGDLGGALIMTGAIPPHVFMEHLPIWVRQCLVRAATWPSVRVEFFDMDIPNPPIPLGLDRFKIFSEIIEKMERPVFEAWVEKRLQVPLIRSGVEGATLDDLGMDPKTFRVAKSIDGTKMVDEIIKAGGSKPEQQTAALRAIYLTTQLGLAVFGEDQRTPEEQKQVRKLEELREKLEKSDHFQVLGVNAKSTDDEVNAKYKEFAKKYHPDTLREGSLPELVEVRAKVFDLYRKSYEALKDAKKRESYQQLIEQGYDPTLDEQTIVRNILQAEVEFKKAEALMRMRKYAEALETLEKADQLKPDDVEQKIYKQYIKMMVEKQPSSAIIQKAIEEIRVQLKANPKILAGYVFLARLYKLDNQNGKALKAWKIVLEMDANNAEATSELRLARMREEKEKGKKGIFGK